MHAAHQVIVFQHLAHAQRKRQRDTHGQSLGHRNDDKCDGEHHGLDKILCIGNGSFTAGDYILQQTAQYQQTRHHIAATGDSAAQAVELLGERCLDVIVDLGITIDLAILRHVAHALNAHHGISLDDRAGTQQHVGRIGRFGSEGGSLLVVGLPCRWLASERALINPEAEALDNRAVGRHFLSCLQDDDVAHHDVTTRHLGDMAVAHHLDAHMVVGLVEQTEFFVGIDLD